MLEVGYICYKCNNCPVFQGEDAKILQKCPRCHSDMRYCYSAEIDPGTGETIREWQDDRLKAQTAHVWEEECAKLPSFNFKSKPTVTCPYCHSTNCKKITGLSKAGSIALWGIFALGKASKQWHCNKCGSDF